MAEPEQAGEPPIDWLAWVFRIVLAIIAGSFALWMLGTLAMFLLVWLFGSSLC